MTPEEIIKYYNHMIEQFKKTNRFPSYWTNPKGLCTTTEYEVLVQSAKCGTIWTPVFEEN